MSDGWKIVILATLAFIVASLAGFIEASNQPKPTSVEVLHE